MKSEFSHACLESGRDVTRASSICGNGQSVNRRRHARSCGLVRRGRRRRALGAALVHVNRIQPAALRVFFADFDVAEHRAHGVTLTDLRIKFLNRSACGRDDVHVRLVRLDLDDVLIGLDVVAGLDEVTDDCGLGDGFTELRHDDGNLRHNRWLAL